MQTKLQWTIVIVSVSEESLSTPTCHVEQSKTSQPVLIPITKNKLS